MSEVIVFGWMLGYTDEGEFGVASIELIQNMDLDSDFVGTVGLPVRVKESKFYFPYYQEAEEDTFKTRMLLTKYEMLNLKLTQVNIGNEDLDYSVASELYDQYFDNRSVSSNH